MYVRLVVYLLLHNIGRGKIRISGIAQVNSSIAQVLSAYILFLEKLIKGTHGKSILLRSSAIKVICIFFFSILNFTIVYPVECWALKFLMSSEIFNKENHHNNFFGLMININMPKIIEDEIVCSNLTGK
jgi:hypothetical protein